MLAYKEIPAKLTIIKNIPFIKEEFDLLITL